MTRAKYRRQGGPSLATYRLGGRTYPLRTVAQCATCSSPHRIDIELQIAQGLPYQRILDALALTDPDTDHPNTASMQRHFDRGHMPFETEVVRRTLERRAQHRGVDMDAAIEDVVDGVAFAEIVMRRSFQAIARGELEPSIKDGLDAAKIVQQFAPHEQAASESAYVEAFMIFHETAQDIMTEGQFAEFGKRLSANEHLRALIAEHGSPDQVQDEDEDFYAVPTAIESGEVVSEDGSKAT